MKTEINYNDFKEMTAEMAGIELIGRCIETSVKADPTKEYVEPTLTVMGITYAVQIPRSEANLKGFVDAWIQIIELFGATHMSGQADRINNQGMTTSEVTPILN